MRECAELKLRRDLLVFPDDRREDEEVFELRGVGSREWAGVS